jgi:hypothetical protein
MAMGQLVTQSVQTELVLIITETDGLTAKTGVLFSAVTALYRKAGQASFTAKTVTALNWREIGSGWYGLTFTAAELDTLGVFLAVVTTAGASQSNTEADIIAAASASTPPPAVQTCILNGHVTDVLGNPVSGAAVSARLLGTPVISGAVAVSSDELVTVKTDNNGEFFLTLQRLLFVEIFIPVANYRRQLTVPNSSTANLFTVA